MGEIKGGGSMRYQRLVWPLFAAIMGFAFGGSFVWGVLYAPPEQYAAHSEHADSGSTKKEHKNDFWEKAVDDPVAYFTFWLVAFTGVLAVSTAGLWIATIWLYRAGERQLEFLQESAATQSRDMQASILAAQRSADAAMMAIGTERAWITIEQPKIIPIHDGFLGEVPFKTGLVFSVICKNRGRSPAVKVLAAAFHQIGGWLNESPIPHFTQTPDWETPGKSSLVGPDAQFDSGSIVLVDAEAEALTRGQVAIFIYCILRYFDVFKPSEPRFTEACLKIRSGGGVQISPSGERSYPWEVQVVGEQNGAT